MTDYFYDQQQQSLMKQLGKRRVKTEGSPLLAEIQRQKSIFKNLSWQDKQKQRKIDFLERYYAELQQVVRKQKKEDSELLQRAKNFIKKRKEYVNKSSVLKQLQQPTLKQKVALYLSYQRENEEESQNDFLQDIYFSGGPRHKR